MPWKKVLPMFERASFVQSCLTGEESFSALCETYGISRRTGYTWLRRYEEEGEAGLCERSRAPHRQARQVPAEVEHAIVALRGKHPTWGPKKLHTVLAQVIPAADMPSRTTIANILSRLGLALPRSKKRRASPSTQPLAHAVECNLVWCIDFKGWFCTADGCRVYPLTITDAHSRYLIQLQGMRGATDTDHVMALMKTAFRAYGLPQRIRSDNGAPFASTGLAGLSRLSVWWMRLGIVHERIEPGKPQQNGRHERFHLTLKQETASPPAQTFAKQQAKFRLFQYEYNEVRPHEALGQTPPAALYQPSLQQYPSKLPPLEYPDEMTRRCVRGCGQMKWKNQDVRVTSALTGQQIGLLPIEDALWSVHFCAAEIGVFDERTMRVYSTMSAVPKTGNAARRKRISQARAEEKS